MAISKIGTNLITDATIATADLADNSITSAKIVNGTIATADLADDAITAAKLATNAVVTASIVAGSVDTTELAADAVTGAKIEDNAVDSEHYVDGSIDTAHISDNAVTIGKMADLARGKIIYGDSSGNPAVLAVGSNGQALVSDGTDISWGSGGAISSYTNPTNNRVITSVDSSTVNSEANLTFDGSTLAVTGAATVSTTLGVTGAITGTAASTITTADNLAQLTLISTDTDANQGPILNLNRNPSEAGADNDYIGQIYFTGHNDAGTPEDIIYSKLTSQIIDASDGAEDANMVAYVMKGGARKDMMRLGPDSVVFNESSEDIDFRVESDNDADALFIQGSDGNVGIGTTSPAQTLHVASGQARFDNHICVQPTYKISLDGGAPGDTYISEVATNTMNFVTGGAEQMRLAGNIISVKDAARLSLRTSDANTYIAAPSANVIGFYTGDTQRVNINSGGTVTIDQDSNAHALVIDSEATSGQGISMDGEQTTGSGIMMDMDALTTGSVISANSNSSSTASRSLVSIINDHASATGTTALYVRQDSTNKAAYMNSTTAADNRLVAVFEGQGIAGSTAAGGQYVSITRTGPISSSSGNICGGLLLGEGSNILAAQCGIRGTYEYTNGRDVEIFTSSDNTSAPTTKLWVMGSGKVGIGTGSPTTSKLHVHDTKNSAGAAWTAIGPGNMTGIISANESTTDNTMAGFLFGTGTAPNIRGGMVMNFVDCDNDSTLSFATTNTSGDTRTKMTILGDGNVGIGHTDPESSLEVGGTGIQINDGTGGTSPKLVFGTEPSTNAAAKCIFMQSYWMKIQGHRNEGVIMHGVNASGTVQEFLRLTGDNNSDASEAHFYSGGGGKVGINTSSPDGTLDVNNPTAGVWTGIFDNTANGGAGVLIKSAGATGSENLLDIRNGSITAFVLKQATGRVGIGTASPTANLHVSAGNPNNSSDAILYVSKTGGNDFTCWLGSGADNYGLGIRGVGGYAWAVYDHNAGAYRARLQFGGDLYLQNTTVNSISDRRLKKNIVDANSQWNDIKALKWRNFEWKDEYIDGTYLGLIADEVESISPNLVEINAQPKEDIDAGIEDPKHKAVKYSIVWMKAMKALQEAQTRIETLEAKVAALEG